MRTLLTASLGTVLALATASAQRVHQGFWIGVAPGGVGVVETEGLAYPLYLRLGGTINQQLLVGVEWYNVVLDLRPAAAAANLTAVALFYPSKKGILFTRAGVGLGRAESHCPDRDPDAASGLGITLGSGVEIRIGRNVYLTPSIDFLWQGAERALCPGPGNPGSGTVRGYSPGFFFALGITWH
jgi:hypothetical protein